MRQRELDDAQNPTVWTTPHERTKSMKKVRRRREYLTPLPALAQRILQALPNTARDDLVFPGRLTGKPLHAGAALVRKLVKHGAPAGFYPHALRHTVATFLKMQGYSEWDRGLVLNHAESSVTVGYSHGHALERKRELLERWSAPVESLIA